MSDQSTPDTSPWAAPAAAAVSPQTPQPGVQPDEPDPEAVGAAGAAAGGTATDVDSAALLKHIQELQGRVSAMEAEKRSANADPLVTYAEALGNHLQAKADANPVVNADPDYTWRPALVKAASLIDEAGKAADGGSTDTVVKLADDVAAWVRSHAKRFRSIDYSYIEELVESVKAAAAKLAA